jgi:hypothetical protein
LQPRSDFLQNSMSFCVSAFVNGVQEVKLSNQALLPGSRKSHRFFCSGLLEARLLCRSPQEHNGMLIYSLVIRLAL